MSLSVPHVVKVPPECVPVAGPLLRLLILIVVVGKQDGGWNLTSATWEGAIGELGADAAIR